MATMLTPQVVMSPVLEGTIGRVIVIAAILEIWIQGISEKLHGETE